MPKVRGKGDEAKRHNVSLRVTPAVMERLDAAIAESGRSLAQELESRVVRSFEIEEVGGGWETDALMRLLAAAIGAAEEKAGGRWTDDPAAHAAVQRVVELFIASKSPKLATLLEPETFEILRRSQAALDQRPRMKLGDFADPEVLARERAAAELKASMDALLDPLIERTVQGRRWGDEIAELLLK